MRHLPPYERKPLCPLLCVTADRAVSCQEEWCAWYSPLHGCAINALASLEDIASKE